MDEARDSVATTRSGPHGDGRQPRPKLVFVVQFVEVAKRRLECLLYEISSVGFLADEKARGGKKSGLVRGHRLLEPAELSLSIGDPRLFQSASDHPCFIPDRASARTKRVSAAGCESSRPDGVAAAGSEPRQQSNANQHNSLRRRWSSSTSSRISWGSWARCRWHSKRPAASRSPSAAAARAALIA